MLLIIVKCSALVGLGKVAWHAVANHETVPYTSRKHTVLLPPVVERAVGQHAMARVQKKALCQGYESLRAATRATTELFKFSGALRHSSSEGRCARAQRLHTWLCLLLIMTASTLNVAL